MAGRMKRVNSRFVWPVTLLFVRPPVREKRTEVSQLPDGEGTLADYVLDDAPLIEEVLSY